MNAFYKDVPAHMLANFQTLDDIHGHTYFVPIGYNVMSIWYNRALFKEFNVPEPAPGWTWDEFASAATKIADAPNRYGFYLDRPGARPIYRCVPVGAHQRRADTEQYPDEVPSREPGVHRGGDLRPGPGQEEHHQRAGRSVQPVRRARRQPSSHGRWGHVVQRYLWVSRRPRSTRTLPSFLGQSPLSPVPP